MRARGHAGCVGGRAGGRRARGLGHAYVSTSHTCTCTSDAILAVSLLLTPDPWTCTGIPRHATPHTPSENSPSFSGSRFPKTPKTTTLFVDTLIPTAMAPVPPVPPPVPPTERCRDPTGPLCWLTALARSAHRARNAIAARRRGRPRMMKSRHPPPPASLLASREAQTDKPRRLAARPAAGAAAKTAAVAPTSSESPSELGSRPWSASMDGSPRAARP